MAASEHWQLQGRALKELYDTYLQLLGHVDCLYEMATVVPLYSCASLPLPRARCVPRNRYIPLCSTRPIPRRMTLSTIQNVAIHSVQTEEAEDTMTHNNSASSNYAPQASYMQIKLNTGLSIANTRTSQLNVNQHQNQQLAGENIGA